LFYPMEPPPASLALDGSSGTGHSASTLPLDFAHALHVPAIPANRVSGQQFARSTRASHRRSFFGSDTPCNRMI
jgi:hypothetical protein